MSADDVPRTRSLDRALAGLARLRRVEDPSAAEVARLVVEPAVAFLGWPVLNPRVVRRGVHVAARVPPPTFVLHDPAGPLVVLFARATVDREVERELERFASSLILSLARFAVISDGQRWVGMGVATRRMFLDCSIEDPRLLFLDRERIHRPEDSAPQADEPQDIGPRSPPPSKLAAGWSGSETRSWDPLGTRQEVETWTKPRFVDIKGTRYPVSHWWEVVRQCASYHLDVRGTLPGFVFAKQQGPYASRNPGDLRRPEAIDGGWHVEMNLDAHRAHRVATWLLKDAGIREGESLVVFD